MTKKTIVIGCPSDYNRRVNIETQVSIAGPELLAYSELSEVLDNVKNHFCELFLKSI